MNTDPEAATIRQSDEEKEYLEYAKDRWGKEIRAALKVIKPKASLRDDCIAEIADSLNSIGIELANLGALTVNMTKKGKAAASKVAAALRRLQTTLNNPDLDMQFEFFPHSEIDKWLGVCDEIAATPTREARSTDPKHLLAAREALFLLSYYAPDRDKAIATTKGGRFCKLAAVLAGEPDADLHHACRAARRGDVRRMLTKQITAPPTKPSGQKQQKS
jgi:hypothetical protein